MDIEITPLQLIQNELTFLNSLEDETVRNKIPLLNVNKTENIKNGSLVRYIGMIQDMCNSDYYLEKFQIINEVTGESMWTTSKYQERITLKDNEYIDHDNPSNVTSEVQTFVVISVPALNNWVQLEESKFKLNTSLPESCSYKRPLEECMQTEEVPSTSQNKKVCKDQNKEPSNVSVAPDCDIFPLPNTENCVYHLRVYKDQDQVKVNDVCEFIGFLNTDIVVNDDDEMVESTEGGSYFRIHCVNFRKIKHNNPLLGSEPAVGNEDLYKARTDLLIILNQLFLGDELAAEYFLYHLISEVYSRKNGMVLGKFSLNISHIPTFPNLSFTDELYKFIEKLVPKSFYLAMSLENLNDLTFTPKKNYDKDYLSSGVLQLSKNTHFVLDETKLSPGKLNEAGINNVKALRNSIQQQTVTYDFKYYPLEFECDIPFLVLSEGKSMLPTDIQVRLEPDEMCIKNFKEIIEASNFYLKPSLLNNIRKYLTVARMSEYSLSDKNEEFIQNEFVKMRQDRSVTGDDLHQMLILSRLISLSRGKVCFDEESWATALELEKKRKIRIK